MLAGINLNNRKDRRTWKLDENNGFSVNSYYTFIDKEDDGINVTALFKQIWKISAPPKIAFFLGKCLEEVS